MSPTTFLRSQNDSGACTKRTIRRCTKEDDAANGTGFDENQNILRPGPLPTPKWKVSSISLDLLQSVRQHITTSKTECLVPHKTTSQHAVKNSGSPTEPPSRKYGPRRRQQSGSLVEFGPALQATKKSAEESKLPHALDILPRGILVPLSQNTSGRYTLEDLNMQIRCYERHVTTWDMPHHAFFIFPAQLLITCASKCDFDPLIVPEVNIIDLTCSTVAMGGPHNLHRPMSFSTLYDGAIIAYASNEPKCDLTRGIHVEGASSKSWSSTMNGDGHFGWYLRFWIPIPFVLFRRAETRSFKIHARVHVSGAEDQDGHLIASSDFTLTRLLRGLAM